MRSYPDFVKVKDKYCIVYRGPAMEYAIQLLCLLPYIEATFKGLTIYFAFREFNLQHPRITPLSKVGTPGMGHYYEITTNLETNPIVDLIEECNIEVGPARIVPQPNHSTICHISRPASLPARSLTPQQVDYISRLVASKGYQPIVSDDANAGWVIGPEGGTLFLAASCGIKTSLVPTGGSGVELYKKLFPDGEIMQV